MPVKRAVEWIRFSPDDRDLITLSEQEFLVSGVEGAGAVRSFSVPAGGYGVAIHPTGPLIVCDGAGRLTLWNFLSGECQKRLFVGGKRDLRPLMQLQAMVVQRELAKFKSDEWEEDLRKKMLAEIEKMRAQCERLGKRAAALPGGMDLGKFIESREQNLEKTIGSMKEQMTQAATPDNSLESQVAGSASVRCLEISRDGRWLACGTADGVLVFSWDEILRADETPVPAFSAANAPIMHQKGASAVTMPGYTLALAFDEVGGRLLFSGGEGLVRELDLSNGASAVLFDPPQRRAIIQMALSADRRGLCCVGQPPMERRRSPAAIQIWNYRLLSERRLRVVAPDE